MKRFISIRHYITFLRRQSRHMQEIYAVIFAGSVTIFLGAIILYYDYGFWRDSYDRNEVIQTKNITKSSTLGESPNEMLGGFLKEAKVRLQAIGNDNNTNLLKGKDTYQR